MTAGVLAVAGALLWAPGALIARWSGVPRGRALVLGPALTWGVVAGGSVVVPRAGLRWGPLSALGAWAALALVAAAPRALARALRRRSPDPLPASSPDGAGTPRRGLLLVGAGIAAAAAVLTTAAWRARVRPRDVDQLLDALWHANLTESIARTGSSDPAVAPGQLTGAGWRSVVPTYYPDGLHATAAIVERLTGADAALSVTAVVLVVYVALLPTAAATLTWTLTGGSASGAAAAAVLSVLPVAYPTDHWWRGVWAYGVSVAAALLASDVVLRALTGRLVPGGRARGGRAAGRAGSGVLAVLAVLGVVGLQPAGAVVGLLVVLAWSVGQLARLPWRRALAWGVPVAAVLAVLPSAVGALVRRSTALASLAAYDYRSLAGWGPALRVVLGLVVPVDPGLGYPVPVQPPQWGLTAVLLAALVLTAIQRSTAWLAALWVLVVGAAADTLAPVAQPLRVLTLFFYASPYRLVAVVAVLGAVMGGVAVARVARWRLWRHRAGAALGVVAAVAACTALAAGTVERAQVRLRAGYADRVVGPRQEAVMRVLADQPLPRGARVLNDPADGSAWMYALTGVRPVFTTYRAGQVPAGVRRLLRHLDAVDTDAAVQAELRRLRVCYVYTSAGTVTARRHRALGLAALESSPHAPRWLEPVARSGPAAAYRVLVPGTPCAPGTAP